MYVIFLLAVVATGHMRTMREWKQERHVHIAADVTEARRNKL